ncbi:MAG: CHAT domain-containing protein [Betaproteobacteria bacterium]|nr:CHAT domain-containing protein [Betaproteobacteria bacterium]
MRWRHFVPGIFFFGVSACLLAQDLPREIGAEAALGKNLTGDECVLRRVQAGGWGEQAMRYAFHCEGWNQPSGTLVIYPRHARDLAWWLGESPWARGIEENGSCEPARADKTAHGLEASMRPCQHRQGWRRIMLAAKAGEARYLADFLPNNAPLVERALLGAIGRAPQPGGAPQGRRLASLRALEELLGTPEAMPSLRDLGQYLQYRELAQEQQRARHYRQAELTWQSVVRMQERLFGPASAALAASLQEMAHTVRNQRRLDDAMALVRRAEPIVAAARDPILTAHQLIHQAYDLQSRRRHAESLPLAEQAVNALRDEPRLRFYLGEAYFAKSVALHGIGDFAGVEQAARMSMGYMQRSEGAYGVWTNRARLQAVRGLIGQRKFAAARPLLGEALDIAETTYGRGIWWANAKIIEGALARAEGNTAQALDAYRAYAEVAAREQFACYFAPCAPAQLDALIAAATADLEAAPKLFAETFAAAQLVESPVLATALNRLAARLATDEPAIGAALREQQDLQESQNRLRAELGAESRKGEKQRSVEREAKLAAELAKLNQAGRDQELLIQDRFPRYAQMLSRRPVSAEQVMARLAPDEGLIFLASTPEGVYGFLVHGIWGRIHFSPFEYGEQRRAVTRLRASIVAKDGVLPVFDARLAHDLYRRLFKPLLDGQRTLRRLVIVPTGSLMSLPPEVLLSAAPQPGEKPAWLLRDHTVSVLPSVGAFLKLREAGRARSSGGFLAVAAPRFASSAQGSKRVAGDPCGGDFDARSLVAGLAPLPESADEARALANAWSPQRNRLLLGETANKAALRQALGEKPAIVAFATHGLLPEELFCENEPALALSPRPGESAEDGLLRASEIIGLPIDAELVILSACNTAGADGRLGGESFSGLTRAFFHAGARNVLATHWPIDSRATVALMEALAKARAKGASWPAALREAKRVLADRAATAHPFYWGAFSLVGGG